MKRLEENCYGDTITGLFVDQKWMNFIPLFYLDNVLITKHAGINVAIWNLHERTLCLENNIFHVKDCLDNKYPLLFYHFSGFDPNIDKIINRRHPNFNTDTYPSFKPLIEEYRGLVLKNGYSKYHSLNYSFNTYKNGYPILSIHRKLLKKFVAEHDYVGDPFEENDSFYQLLDRNNCIMKKKYSNPISLSSEVKNSRARLETKYLIPFLKFTKKIVGIRTYQKFCVLGRKIGDLEYHDFLINN